MLWFLGSLSTGGLVIKIEVRDIICLCLDEKCKINKSWIASVCKNMEPDHYSYYVL